MDTSREIHILTLQSFHLGLVKKKKKKKNSAMLEMKKTLPQIPINTNLNPDFAIENSISCSIYGQANLRLQSERFTSVQCR